MKFKFFGTFFLLIFIIDSWANQFEWLCGSDEDGCHDYRYCACIPYIDNSQDEDKRFCLDFDKLECHPISQVPDCYSLFIYDTQGECLATIFQSEHKPPCELVTFDFCQEHQIAQCDESGRIDSCH